MKKLLCSVLCILLMLVMLPVPAFAVEGCIVDYVPDASHTIQELYWAWGYDKPGGKYPDDVAGLYVKNKKAVVALVMGASAARKSEISTLVTDPKLIQFKDAKYSYNELDALKDTLDTNGQFQLLSLGVDEEMNCIMVEVTCGGKRAAQVYYKQYGTKIKVTEGEPDTLLIGLPSAEDANINWLKAAFPKLTSLESVETRFAFASAPKVTKTRAVLNKKGESLTLYRFASAKEFTKCIAMIKGSTLVYGGRTVYVDTLFPATWYINENENVIALYCGAYEAYNKKLQETFVVAGGYGGYFDDRSEIESADGSIIYSPPRDEMPPSNVQALTKKADGIYLIKVKNTPSWGEGIDIKGWYELEVTKIIKGASRASFNLTRWQCPGVMHAGRSYVLFTRNVAAQTGGTSITFADGVYHSAFEVDHNGYVLPIREYGMKAPMNLASFLKMCK